MKSSEIANLVNKESSGKNVASNLLRDISDQRIPESLDQLEFQILELKKRIQENIWLLGQRLDFIKEKELYKDNFNTFEDYINSLDIGRSTVYNSIKIFKSYDYVQTSGHDQQKLILLAQKIKEKEERIKYLDIIKSENWSYRKIRDYFSESKPVKTYYKRNGFTFKLNLSEEDYKNKISEFTNELENLLKKYKIIE